MSVAFSSALDNVLQALNPGQRPDGEAYFPSQCRGVNLRVNTGEPPAQWFKRLVDGPLKGDIQACTLEPNLALFLQFGWERGPRFKYINCQALAVQRGTLEDVYSGDPNAQERYLRLEYDADPLMLGELFSHPVVHIHGQPEEAPRFALESSGESNPVLLDFMDFLYRNFCHGTWSKWASAVWRRAAPNPGAAPYFNVISDYFLEDDTPGKRAKLPGIRELCWEWFPRMKRAFREAKQNMPMSLPVDPDHRDLFTYHH